MDGDLDLDLVVANFSSDDISVLLNLCAAQFCPWDFDGDGAVGVSELLLLIMSFGPCGQDCPIATPCGGHGRSHGWAEGLS